MWGALLALVFAVAGIGFGVYFLWLVLFRREHVRDQPGKVRALLALSGALSAAWLVFDLST